MATKLYDDTNFTNIANAIRNKLGKNTTYKPRNMASAIYSILTAQEVYPTDTASSNTNEVTIIDGANKGRFTSFRVAIPPYRNGSGDPTPTNIRRYAVTGGAGRFYYSNVMVSFTYTHNIIGGYFDLAQKKVQSSFEPRLLINYEVKTFTDNGVTIFYVDWLGTGDSPKILGCEYLKYVGDFSSLSEACANMPNNSIGGAKDAASGSYFCFMRADDFSTPEAFKEAIGLYSIMIACDYLYDDDDFSSVDIYMKNIVRGKSSYKVEILTNTFGSSEVWQGVNIGTNFMADPELYKDKAIMDVSPQDTVSGAIANFPDGSDGYPIVELKANIEPIQEGTGDPSPSNVRPISGRSSCKVTRAGSNFWGGAAFLQSFIDADINSFTYDDTTLAYGAAQINRKVIFKRKFKANTQYTIVISGKNSNATPSTNLVVFYTDGTYSHIQWAEAIANTKQTVFYTTNGNKTVDYIRGGNYSGTATLYYEECGLFEGVITATDYEAYQGEDYIIPLGEDPIYGGVLNVTTGVVESTYNILDLGNLVWTYRSAISGFSANIPAMPLNTRLYCEIYTYSDKQYVEQLPDQQVWNKSNAFGPHNIVIKDTRFDNVTDFKNAVTGYKLCYATSTPGEIQLTPEEVTTLLGTNNIFADSGDVEVKYRADIALYIEKIKNS